MSKRALEKEASITESYSFMITIMALPGFLKNLWFGGGQHNRKSKQVYEQFLDTFLSWNCIFCTKYFTMDKEYLMELRM